MSRDGAKSHVQTEMSSPSHTTRKGALLSENYNTQQTDRTVEKPGHVRYGTYREVYDSESDRLNMIYFHCVPSALEFETMIKHAAGRQVEEEAKA